MTDREAALAPLTADELEAHATSGVLGIRAVAEIIRLRATSSEIVRAAQMLVNVCPRPDDEEGRQRRDEALAVLSRRTPTADEWMKRAAEEIAAKWGTPAFEKAGGLVAILRKHRDGKM